MVLSAHPTLLTNFLKQSILPISVSPSIKSSKQFNKTFSTSKSEIETFISSINKRSVVFESKSIVTVLSPLDVLDNLNYNKELYEFLLKKTRFSSLFKE